MMRATSSVALSIMLVLAACGGDDDTTTSGSGASGATGGTGGTGGVGGSGGTGGAGGTGGTGGTGSGMGGAGGGEAAAFTFFVTSVGSGNLGGNLGGLAGADQMCQDLADAAGVGNATWRAYLSTAAENARDRIGTGPWFNHAGEMIAADVDALHNDGLSNGNPQHILDEYGDPAPVSEHDILTGSDDDGNLFGPGATCADWTSDSGGMARLGHSDIPSNPQFSPSWNNAHNSQGCSPGQLASTGGSGRLYCFAL